tara:strand:+ start:199 stop:1812 length:1614 start_codon:yes stop_codon:yes gene_type:complete
VDFGLGNVELVEGKIQKFASSFTGTTAIGDAEVAEFGAFDDVAFARWTNGTINGIAYGANQGFHVMSGTASTSFNRSGLLTYDLVGSTRATLSDGSAAPGTFSGKLAIATGAVNPIGWDLELNVGNYMWRTSTVGGAEDPSQSDYVIQSDFTFGGAVPITAFGGDACKGTCNGNVSGQLYGADGAYIGLGFNVNDSSSAGFVQAVGLGIFALNGGGTDPVPPGGTTRSGQLLAYSGTRVGIDARQPVDVTYSDYAGAPIAYVWTLNDYTIANEHPTIGTARQIEAGSVGEIISWARWADGTTGGSSEIAMTANQGWHLITGAPPSNIPTTGTVTYELVSQTAPTNRDGSLKPGLFVGNLAVAFGAAQPRVGFDFQVSIGGDAYNFGTPGGAADASNGGRPVELTGDYAYTFGSGQDMFLVTGGGPLCGGSGDCTASFRGFLAGEEASHVGVSYTFGNLGYDHQVDGVAAFGLPGFVPPTTSASLEDWSRWTGVNGGAVPGVNIDSIPMRSARYEAMFSGDESISIIRERLGPYFSFR